MSMQHLAKGLSVLADRHASVRQQVDEALSGVENAQVQGGKPAFDRAMAELRKVIETTHALVEASHATASAMADRVVPAYATGGDPVVAAPVGRHRPARTSLPAGE